jgi:hemoglobin
MQFVLFNNFASNIGHMAEPQNNNKIPSLFEWMGGMDKFQQLTDIFYKKVLTDPLLEPIFRHMSPDHQRHVANFIAEVFGGPKAYTGEGGSHAGMVQHHFGRHLTEQQRRQWVKLLIDAADEIKLPEDPEFRSAFIAYIEWGTRIAVINSNVEKPSIEPVTPMPEWGWGVPGKPYIEPK